jgi:hypothetical protein
MRHILFNLPNNQIKQTILQQSTSNQSNVLLVAAFHSSENCLKLLLHIVSSWRCFVNTLEASTDMNSILHSRNDYGDTLLSLVLQHREALQIPKHIVLGLEREFHAKDDSMIHCFNKHLVPSIEVLEAINDVENAKPKGACSEVGIWIKTFLTSFIVPVSLMTTDILFDVLLVNEYWAMDQSCLEAQWRACHNNTMITLVSDCGNTTTDPVPMSNGMDFFCLEKNSCATWNETGWNKLAGNETSVNLFCIPLKLDQWPRIAYSVGFIIWPWVYYFIEFLHSPIFKEIRQVSYF